MKVKTFLKSSIFSIVGALSGILSIVFSCIVFSMATGLFESSKSYGGAAYTGIQNASAQVANNVQDLCELVKMGLGSILLVMGIALIAYFGNKICQSYKKVKVIEANTEETITPPENAVKTNDVSQ